MSIDLQFLTQFMLQNFDQTTVSSNGTHFLSRCFICGDSKKNPYKKRFNMDWNNGVPGWHCWNCGRHGNFYEIYSIVKGLSYDDAKKEIFTFEASIKQYKKRGNIKSVSINSQKEEKEKEEDDFNWMKDKCYTIDDEDGMLCKQYINHLSKFIEDRKIPEVYKIYICHSGKYKGRIIIPIFNERGRIIYFQARRIPNTKIEPKYDNPVAPKELCILNRHKFDRDKDIIVHEGLIDAFMVGNQGTSCLGKELSEDLIKELLSLTDKNVIIALDNDAEAYKALSRFMLKNKYAQKVKYFLYPKEFRGYDDINSIVRSNEKGIINIYKLITQNSVSYSTAYTILSIQKLLGGNRDENNSDRKRLHKSK
jgi:hypothetical protein